MRSLEAQPDVDRLGRRSSTLPHVAAGHLLLGELHARAASLQGLAHVLSCQPRQDAFGLLASEDGRWLLCGVADGLGSEPYSAFGADTALRAGLAALEDVLASPTPVVDDGAPDDRAFEDGHPGHDHVVAAAVEAAQAEADTLGVPHRAVSTTLVLAAVPATPLPEDEGRRCLVVAAGDSHALRLGKDGAWGYLTEPGGEHPSNIVETYIPGAPEGAVALSARLAPGDLLVLASDGLTVPLADGENTLGRILAERWLPQARDLMRFTVDLTFDGYHDDRTAVAVWC